LIDRHRCLDSFLALQFFLQTLQQNVAATEELKKNLIMLFEILIQYKMNLVWNFAETMNRFLSERNTIIIIFESHIAEVTKLQKLTLMMSRVT